MACQIILNARINDGLLGFSLGVVIHAVGEVALS